MCIACHNIFIYSKSTHKYICDVLILSYVYSYSISSACRQFTCTTKAAHIKARIKPDKTEWEKKHTEQFKCNNCFDRTPSAAVSDRSIQQAYLTASPSCPVTIITINYDMIVTFPVFHALFPWY